jgi:PKD repeat protein
MFRASVSAVLLLISSFAQPAAGQGSAPSQANAPRTTVAVHHDTSKLLSKLPQLPPRAVGAVLRRKVLPWRIGSEGATGDNALQVAETSATSSASPGVNFEGLNNVNAVLPPDTVGDVGPNHYVQMVNLSLQIWDRAGNSLYGPVDGNTLWQGFGGPCETTNDGDPIVLYDQLADRWILTQFALPNFPKGPFYECIAVSQSGDPTGAYHRYQFLISDTKLNDYPKFGVWPDGYYMSVNQFTCSVISCSWAGQGVVAFEREKMLSGLSARMVYFDLYGLDPNLGGMLPADLDGPAPPAGAPNAFCQIDDDAWGYSPDQIQCWNFRANWTDPALSTFTLDKALTVLAFDSNMCGYSRNCIPQPETSVKVDAIPDRLMYRLQYRNFGTHQTLVTNHTVDATGSDRAGVRWYELRDSGSGWAIHQQSTYAPGDGHHRWMASAAMNRAGDIAVGFSISSGTMFPSIRVSGRLGADLPGMLTEPELTIADGAGHQTHSSGRWGDYSMMAVDPVDDCTFWYTQEYYGTKSSASWQTRIGAFTLSSCGPVNAPPVVAIEQPAEGAIVAGSVSISIAASDTEDATGSLTVEWNVDGGVWQPATYDISTSRYIASWNTLEASEGAHTIQARATDSGGKTASDTNAVTVDNRNDQPVASFAVSCSGLTCSFDGGTSSDPDGSITAYAWDFGDGATGSGATVAHTYAAAGTYTVTLTVTDDLGATGTTSKSVSVAQTMHVGDLDRASTNNGSTWTAVVTIEVHAADHQPLSGAVISGTWSNGASGSSSCTTGVDGRCTVTKSGIAKRISSVKFAVGTVTASSWTYASVGNHDPDGDSDGTNITVLKP